VTVPEAARRSEAASAAAAACAALSASVSFEHNARGTIAQTADP
jgi:hypothetical protein